MTTERSFLGLTCDQHTLRDRIQPEAAEIVLAIPNTAPDALPVQADPASEDDDGAACSEHLEQDIATFHRQQQWGA
ncbi:hypothetical protein [Methylobacterium sp. Leaf117]|uniref:hypothetical protein n=1 Tax=Methylobacterium sp. Leaf117 TaxID=1736260 RepID=UPI000AACB084|nr:hypothetical protein [Methylobacterium sp. Leaf117]